MLLCGGACKNGTIESTPGEPTREVTAELSGDSGEQNKEIRKDKQDEKKQEGVRQEQNVQNVPEVTPSPEIRELIEATVQNQVTETADRTAVVRLNGSDAEITGSGCKMDGNRLEIKKAGVYEISGNLSDGSIYVNVDNESEVHLILNGVTVHNEMSAALFCKKAAKVTITLAEGSENRFSDGASYVFEEGEDEPDSTVYAKHDLVINGTGKLYVTSAYGDALKGKDSLYILGGEIVVKSAEDGIVGRDLLYIADGTVTVTAAADALKVSNDTDTSLGNMVIDGGTFVLTSETDGMQAENTLTVNSGDFTIKTGGGAASASVKTEDFGFGGGGFGDWGNWDQGAGTETEDTASSAKGLKAGVLLAVNGGRFTLDTCDDALHGNTNVTVTGGDFSIATGDDGMHADEKLLIEGSAKIKITKSYEGLEALEIVINGGEIDITASDDGLNAAGGNDGSGFGGGRMGMFGEGEGEVTVNGGTVVMNAGGDGLDSNGNLTINGGTVVVFGPTSGGNGVLDFGGSFAMNGGSLLAAGTSSMSQTPGDGSAQYSLAAVLTSSEQAGSRVEITVNGKTVISETVPKRFDYVVASTGDFAKGAEVSVLVDGKESYSGTLTDKVTCFGFSGGMGGFGGFDGFGGDKGQGGFGGNEGQGGFGGNWGNRGDREDFGGGMPQRPDGEMPQMPQMPDGGWSGFFDGEMPEKPDAGMPSEADV